LLGNLPACKLAMPTGCRIPQVHCRSPGLRGRLADGSPFLVMEYIDGRTLRDLLDADARFPAREARDLLALVLGWLYDITSSGIYRTQYLANSERLRTLKWIGLGASVLCAALIAWLLLRAG
jgi:hypothetical protein